MAGMVRKGMSWLGLGPDDEYDDYDDHDFADPEPMVDLTAPPAAASHTPAVRAVPQRPPVESRRPEMDEWDDPEPASVRVLPSSGRARPSSPTAVAPEPVRPRGVVRPVPAAATAARPHVVTPKSFNDAQEVGDWFRKRQPVIVNLQELDRDLARRLLDFSSGVAYGLGGTVERVASHVYLLSPVDVEISPDDRRRLRERGLVDD